MLVLLQIFFFFKILTTMRFYCFVVMGPPPNHFVNLTHLMKVLGNIFDWF